MFSPNYKKIFKTAYQNARIEKRLQNLFETPGNHREIIALWDILRDPVRKKIFCFLVRPGVSRNYGYSFTAIAEQVLRIRSQKPPYKSINALITVNKTLFLYGKRLVTFGEKE